MRDDVFDAFDWCRKHKIPIEKAVIIEEANFFHPSEKCAVSVHLVSGHLPETY
jgi:hypothetical protein